MRRIVETTLVSSAGTPAKLPPESLPEVAFAGRSNVGKSSLLNALTGRRGLFKISKTPGRTRTIVHVEARLDSGARLYLVDLPGYGYAKVARGAKQNWGALLEAYLRSRPTLHLVVLLVDARRGPEDEEAELVDFLGRAGVPCLLAATKIDRIVKSRRKPALEELRARTGVRAIGTSAETREGIDALLEAILSATGFGK
ncbi:MAG TPA: ribosome biogenesis GTP-binding protein YihA/YsxC [Polyangia bacterium]|nr:ribosome biogenesis GTP-binding protein YihA/YsxC [Polyangia bacterium]